MAKQSLIEAFNVKPRKLDTKAVKDYDIFPDKDLLDKLRSKIIQDLIDNNIPEDKMLEQYINDEIDEVLVGYDLGYLERNHIFKSVVLPVPVPPEIIIFTFACTQASKNLAISLVKDPFNNNSSIPSNSLANFLIVKTGPLKDNGGIMAFNLEPSLSLASTIGLAASIVLPKG